jgi:cell division protein FtsX
MSDVPSWLQDEDNVRTAAKVTNNPVARSAAVSAASNPAVQSAVLKAATSPPPPKHDIEAARGSEASEFIIEEETLKQMRNWHTGLRISYIGAAIFLSAAAALAILNQSDIGIIFFAFYVFFFSVLLCCFEFALNVRVMLSAYS